MSDCSSCSSGSPAAQLQQQFLKKLRGDQADMTVADKLKVAQEKTAQAALQGQQNKALDETAAAVNASLGRTQLVSNVLSLQEVGLSATPPAPSPQPVQVS